MASRIANYVHDLRLRRGFMNELPTIRIIRKHGPAAVFTILTLWDWVAGNFPTTGRLERLNADDLYNILQLTPDNKGILEDMTAEGFLAQEDDGTYYIPNWAEDQPYVAQAEERRAQAKANAEKRWAAKDANGNTIALPRDCSKTNPNTKTKKEKSPLPPVNSDGVQTVTVSGIVTLFCEILPELPKPREEAEKLRKDIAAMCKSKPERQNMDWWASYFKFVRHHPYLMGEVSSWRAGLAWLVCRKNMEKVASGHYLTREYTRSKRLPTEEQTREVMSPSDEG